MESTAHEIPALNAMTSPVGFAEHKEWHHVTVYRVALRVMGNPVHAEECSDDGETEHPPQNPDHFREKV